ncbi:MAG: NifU family protein [Alphaproteobacteria bacterium]|nr:NifU family protein [Alphaproteobacteria bacterium]
MFIQTESTPNPATLKFLPNRDVAGEGALYDFPDATSAARSPLARALFEVEGVTRVFFGADFVAVTKADGEWKHLKPPILGAIMEHFQSGQPLMGEGAAAAAEDEDGPIGVTSEEDEDVVEQIVEIIETRVRPAVAQDGGDIIFRGFDSESGTVYLKMRGACSGCPSSTATLKGGIEKMLKHYVPEVNTVVSA